MKVQLVGHDGSVVQELTVEGEHETRLRGDRRDAAFVETGDVERVRYFTWRGVVDGVLIYNEKPAIDV